MESFRFEVAFSFAGDNKREVIRSTAKILRRELGDRKVFFDEWFEAEIAGVDAHVVLQHFYRKDSRLVVTCICKRYGEKPWTQEEWRAIQTLERECRDAGSTNIKRLRILPLRFDDGEIDGLFETAVVPDVRERSPEEIADLILERLRRLTGDDSQAGGSCVDDLPILPPSYLKRLKYLSTLGSVFSETGQGRSRLRVICGPSGVGKTTLVADFFAEARKAFKTIETAWIDCRVTFKMPEILTTLRLVVFDNVGENHPLITQKWLPRVRESIVVLTTTSEVVSAKARGDLMVADHEPSLIPLSGFDEQEALQFFSGSVPRECVDDAVNCARGLWGLPIALQLLREICTAGSPARGFVECSGLDSLIRRWIIEYDDSGSIAALLEALGNLPFVGMDTSAIAQVVGRPIGEILDAANTAKRIGLVHEICVPGMAAGEAFLVLHEAAREVYVHHTPIELRDWTERYAGLLEERITAGRIGATEVLSCVDAWLIGWKQVFDLSLQVTHEERFDRHRKLLERLTADESQAWTAALPSLPHFLFNRLQKPETENCALVIGLAQMIGCLKKGSRALATTIWGGARNPDLWARSASIAAAVNQWHLLGHAFRQDGISNLHLWLEYASQMRERSAYQSESEWSDELDLDYLVVVCGLMRLDSINAGTSVIESSRFNVWFPDTTLSHIAILLKQAETGILETPDRRETFLRQATRWTVSIALSPAGVQQTAARLGAYLSAKFDCAIKPLIALPHSGPEATFSLDIAHLCESQEFTRFIKKVETNPRRHF